MFLISKFSRRGHRVDEERSAPRKKKQNGITHKEYRNQKKTPAGTIHERWLDSISRRLKEQRPAMREQRYELM